MKSLKSLALICAITFIGTFAILKLSKSLISKDKTSIKSTKPLKYVTNVSGEDICSDYLKWKDYNTNNIILASDFIAINAENKIIDKKEFLNNLLSNSSIPLKTKNKKRTYKLFKPIKNNDKINKSVKLNAKIALDYLKRENTIFPNIIENDLNGTVFNLKKIKGIKVIKCWFINCKVCIQEFPEVNKLYKKYSNDNKITFISLAFDKPEKLKKFLTKKEFKYPVIANQKKLLFKDLKIKQYPTHIILDSNNKIIKIVGNVDVLEESLNNVLENKNIVK